jgi:hypothetical protein
MANASILYSNAWNPQGQAYSSQNDVGGTNGNFATVHNFFTTGGATWNVQDIHFVGQYFNPTTQAAIGGFRVNIYADASNAPGTLLSSTYVAAGSFSETSLNPGNAVFQYDMNVTSTIVSGDAWVSVVPDLHFPPQWGWSYGVDMVAAHMGYQTFFGTTTRLNNSLAMDVGGEVVPAPASLGLLSVGGLAAARRRRTK